jgi:hypothetical protein
MSSRIAIGVIALCAALIAPVVLAKDAAIEIAINLGQDALQIEAEDDSGADPRQSLFGAAALGLLYYESRGAESVESLKET